MRHIMQAHEVIREVLKKTPAKQIAREMGLRSRW